MVKTNVFSLFKLTQVFTHENLKCILYRPRILKFVMKFLRPYVKRMKILKIIDFYFISHNGTEHYSSGTSICTYPVFFFFF